MELEGSHKSEWARHTWECVAPIHIRGHCPHPSNHLRRRIHQPSLLPHNIHRNDCAVQEIIFSNCWFFGFYLDLVEAACRLTGPSEFQVQKE